MAVYRLISCEDAKILTKGTFGNEFDFLFDNLIIPAIGDLFASYCHRPDFDCIERTEYFSPRLGEKAIWISSPPISSTPAIQLWEDGDRLYGNDTLLTEGTDYFCYASEGRLQKPGPYFSCFLAGDKTVKVKYTGGYLTGDAKGCPAGLRMAAAVQAKLIFDRREELGLTGRSMEGGSMSLLVPMLLPRNVTEFLQPYRVY